MIEIDNFPYMPMRNQKDCGPTAVLQMLEFLKYPMTRKRLAELWGWKDSNWTDLPIHHHRVWWKLKLHVQWFRADEKTITDMVRRRRPVVILSRLKVFQYHWQIITGFDGPEDKPMWWALSTGLGYGSDSAFLMNSRFFHSHWDSKMFSIHRLAYIVGPNRVPLPNELGWGWRAYQPFCSLGQ